MKFPSEDKDWFIVRTRPRAETKAQDELTQARYEVYLPRKRIDVFNRRQRVRMERDEAAMPGYAFIAQPPAGRTAHHWPAFADRESGWRHVLGPLKGSKGPLQIPVSIVLSISVAETNMEYDETDRAKIHRGEMEKTARLELEKRFAAGRGFLVKEGPFASFMAEVESLTAHDRVKALVNIFGRLTPVEFDPAQLDETPKPKSRARAA